MIRTLEGLILLKELNGMTGIKHSPSQLKKLFPDKIVIIRHNSYIYKDTLCDIAKKQITSLDEYVQLGDLAEQASMDKSLMLKRIKIMQVSGLKLFDYKSIGEIFFIKIDAEFKYLLQNFQPFLANLKDLKTTQHFKLLGDLKIGFY